MTRSPYFCFCWLFPLVFLCPAQATVSIEMVPVGDPGNPVDPADGDHWNEGVQNFGSVSYVYYISKFEVTNAQWVEFLNVWGNEKQYLFHLNMQYFDNGGIIREGSPGSYVYSVKEGFADKPVNWVDFWNVCRFANWLTNGQGMGDTETGVYDLTDIEKIRDNSVVRDQTAWEAGGFALPSEDEWYKAAYYDPSGATADDWWLYPTRSDDVPLAIEPNSTEPNSANHNYALGGAGNVTPVGGYTAAFSHYGTYDQGGNVSEWTDTIYVQGSQNYRVHRGGDYGGTFINSNYRPSTTAGSVTSVIGFRLVSLQPTGGETADWGGFPVVDGFTDTDGLLGVVEVGNAPWVFSFDFNAYLFVPEAPAQDSPGVWLFIPRPNP